MIENAAGDFPQITAYSYGTQTLPMVGGFDHWAAIEEAQETSPIARDIMAARQMLGKTLPYQQQQTENHMDKSTRRIAQIFIADADSTCWKALLSCRLRVESKLH